MMTDPPVELDEHRGGVGRRLIRSPAFPCRQGRNAFQRPKRPSRHRKYVANQKLGYDLSEPAGSGIKRRRQRIGRGIQHLACRRVSSPLWSYLACGLRMKFYSVIDIITYSRYIGAGE